MHCRRGSPFCLSACELRRLPRTRRPERAERAEALAVVGEGDHPARRLPRRQDLAHVPQRLLPQMVRLRQCGSEHEVDG
jgi:hypothetical protein